MRKIRKVQKVQKVQKCFQFAWRGGAIKVNILKVSEGVDNAHGKNGRERDWGAQALTDLRSMVVQKESTAKLSRLPAVKWTHGCQECAAGQEGKHYRLIVLLGTFAWRRAQRNSGAKGIDGTVSMEGVWRNKRIAR